MQINDEGFILKRKKFRESSLIITFFSLNNGINTGLLKGVLKKDFGTYEIGNKVYIKSSFRLENQLWNCSFELIKNNSINYFDNKNKLNALLSICCLIDLTLPSNIKQTKIYNKTDILINNLNKDNFIKEYISWELFLLSELGYGLDLYKCAVSGKKKDLKYVSPKSGKAVSKLEGEKYKNKLLLLPKFLINNEFNPNKEELKNGILLTGFFLKRILKLNGKNIPFYRKNILS